MDLFKIIDWFFGITLLLNVLLFMPLVLRVFKKKATINVSLSEAATAKTEFLENMRHDIRTAVTGMAGLSELLTTETDIQKVHSLSKELAKSSQELLRFLNEILESIQVSSGEIPLLNRKFNLRELLESVLILHQPLAIQKQRILQCNHAQIWTIIFWKDFQLVHHHI